MIRLPSGSVTTISYWSPCGWYSTEFPGVTAKVSVLAPQCKIIFGPFVARIGGGSAPWVSARHFSIAVAALCAWGTPGDLLASNPSVGAGGVVTIGTSNEPAGIVAFTSMLVAAMVDISDFAARRRPLPLSSVTSENWCPSAGLHA